MPLYPFMFVAPDGRVFEPARTRRRASSTRPELAMSNGPVADRRPQRGHVRARQDHQVGHLVGPGFANRRSPAAPRSST